jgi:hypothetical protein
MSLVGHEAAFRDANDAAGYVGDATDYEGLGAPGIRPYRVDPSEGAR